MALQAEGHPPHSEALHTQKTCRTDYLHTWTQVKVWQQVQSLKFSLLNKNRSMFNVLNSNFFFPIAQALPSTLKNLIALIITFLFHLLCSLWTVPFSLCLREESSIFSCFLLCPSLSTTLYRSNYDIFKYFAYAAKQSRKFIWQTGLQTVCQKLKW